MTGHGRKIRKQEESIAALLSHPPLKRQQKRPKFRRRHCVRWLPVARVSDCLQGCETALPKGAKTA
jgi:hypothetical protein